MYCFSWVIFQHYSKMLTRQACVDIMTAYSIFMVKKRMLLLVVVEFEG